MRRLLCALATMVVVAGSSGCGGDKPARGASQAAPVKPAGPPPTVEQIAGQEDQRTPQSTVLAALGYAKWGAWPRLVRLYDPDVAERLGDARISAAYALQRGALESTAVDVLGTDVDGDRAWVTAELRRDGEDARYESYFLKRRGADWRIFYDTYFEAALSSYEQTVAQAGAKDPPPKAVKAGQDAAYRFRRLGLRDAGAR